MSSQFDECRITAWNKGKIVGQKSPLKEKENRVVRFQLKQNTGSYRLLNEAGKRRKSLISVLVMINIRPAQTSAALVAKSQVNVFIYLSD